MVGGVSNPDEPNTRFGEFGQNRIYEIHYSIHNIKCIRFMCGFQPKLQRECKVLAQLNDRLSYRIGKTECNYQMYWQSIVSN